MDENRGYFKLGLFVVVASMLIVASVIALGAHVFTHTETVPVETVISESVAGLESGAPVKYRGVTIGQVSQISFADAKYAASSPDRSSEPQLVLVEMSLDPREFKPLTANQLKQMLAGMVKRGLRVRLSRSLLSGVTEIEINYVDPNLFPAPQLPWTPTELFVPSAPSPMTEVMNGMEKLVAQLNAADIPGLIHHIDGLALDLDHTVNALQIATVRDKAVALIDEIRGSNRHLSNILSSPDLKRAEADLPRVTCKLQQSSARIDEILHDKRVEQLLSGLGSAGSNIGPATADVRNLLQELRELVASQDDNIRIIVSNVCALTDNADATIDDLKQNPSRLILGSPPPRTHLGDRQR
jgi:paraquat-inducible protein B